MEKEKKKERPIIQKMLAALISGIVLGLIFMMVRQNMLDGGNEATWAMINKLLFQDITSADGIGAIGIFYIIGQIFMKGLQAAIVPLVLVSLSLALCSITDSTKIGRVAVKTLIGFFAFYAIGALIACTIAYLVKSAGLFNVVISGDGLGAANTIDAFNPLAVIVNAVPNNITSAFSTNNSILAVVFTAVVIGICMNVLGEKADALKKVFESANEVIQLYLNFLINKIGPVAVFCLVTRTFAIYGAEFLAPAAAYVAVSMVTLIVACAILYPVGIFVTTGLNPMMFLKKMLKVGIFGFSVNSSAATLPLNTSTNLNELGCSEEITSFVLPTGMTINMNGTTMMHMFAVTFIATAAGINVTPANMLVMALLSICAAAGTPAIPVAGTTMIFTVLSGRGWTTDACLLGYALVLAINRPVEMALLPLNVIGDAAVNVIVNVSEGSIDKDVYNS
ncbi:MAG: dicarboxylate/amino acid:cation symporter [Lachnospiraceae bacterium]|nr:dicarboxylate/amino acid:cation symporter [Lachnospiraceae bacterium]